MSKRLQVVLPDQEMVEIRRFALCEARASQPVNAPETKLKAARKASQYSFPAPNIEQMITEIEQGYRS